jgi:hypothetical protein
MLLAKAICFAAVELANRRGASIAGSLTPSQFGSHAEKADGHRDERHHTRRRCP